MIYERIEELCRKKGISISALEKQAGLSNGAIGKWRESYPTIVKLQAVAKVLGVSINKLIN